MEDRECNREHKDCVWCFGGHHFSWLRLLVLIILIGIVFAFGVKVGEYRSYWGYGYGGYGYPMMGGSYGYPYMMGNPGYYNYYYPGGMMQGRNLPQTTPNTP